MNLVENFQIVEAITPQAGAAITGDYISMKNANHVTVLVHIAQGHADPVAVTIEQAKKVDGTGSKAITKNVPIWLVADAATSDLFVAQAAGVGLSSGAALKHKIMAFEIRAEDLDEGYDCLTVKTAASNALNLTSALYILGGLRFGNKSAIVD